VRRALALIVATGAMVATALPAHSADQRAQADTEKTDCTELVPDQASPGLTDDPGGKIKLSVLVLADGVDPKVVPALAKRAATAYAPLNIVFSVDKVMPVKIAADKGSKPPAAETQRMLDTAKKLVGGRRPPGFDVVFVLTNKDIYADAVGDGVVGMADCIGGVESATQAFAVGESTNEPVAFGPLKIDTEVTAKIIGHEIGHLLGAQHHYANCVEGISAADLTSGDVSPCSLMANFVDFQSFKFDVLNSAVVRGHASSYARP
jgi:predicted Zn-dependent protease